MAEVLLVEKEDGLAWLKINRLEVANCINLELLKAIQAVCSTIREDKTICVVALIGAGTKVFSSGADLKERKGFTASEIIDYLAQAQKTLADLESLPQPVIAAINGSAFGGGVELALACDLRIIVSHATLRIPEVKLGIIPGWGGTQRLPRLIGKAKAKELIYRGRPIGAEEAYQCGLVNYVVESQKNADILDERLLAEVRLWANEMANAAPLALRQAKLAIDTGFKQELALGLSIENSSYLQLLNTKDRLEGLSAFAEKRKPNYIGE